MIAFYLFGTNAVIDTIIIVTMVLAALFFLFLVYWFTKKPIRPQ